MSAERWTYLGERKGSTVARVAVWLDERGHRLAYKSTPNVRGSVGYIYAADVERDGDNIKVAFPLDWTGDKHPDCDQLKLEDDAARRELNRAKDERAAAKNLTVSDLQGRAEIAARGLSYDAREELIAQLARTIRKAPWK